MTAISRMVSDRGRGQQQPEPSVGALLRAAVGPCAPNRPASVAVHSRARSRRPACVGVRSDRLLVSGSTRRCYPFLRISRILSAICLIACSGVICCAIACPKAGWMASADICG